MKIKTFFKRLWSILTFCRLRLSYDTLDKKARDIVPIAVHLVQALKSVTIDSKVDDVVVNILEKLFPKFSPLIQTFMLRLEEWIPQWLTELEVAQTIMNIDNRNEQLVAIINALNISDRKSEAYLEFAGKCLYHLNGGEDGILGWEDCKAIAQEYYDKYVKNETDNS